jgi:hypothetical protein
VNLHAIYFEVAFLIFKHRAPFTQEYIILVE